MKKRALLILVSVLLICISLCFFSSCNDEKGDPGNNGENTPNGGEQNDQPGTPDNSETDTIKTSEGLAYTVKSGTATITGIGSCTDTDVIIPSKIAGYPVTSIGNSAFYGCRGLTSITIPNSVTSIGFSAFV